MKNGDMDMGKQGKCFGYEQGEQEICMGRSGDCEKKEGRKKSQT